jgi:hypothetical protein
VNVFAVVAMTVAEALLNPVVVILAIATAEPMAGIADVLGSVTVAIVPLPEIDNGVTAPDENVLAAATSEVVVLVVTAPLVCV